MQYGITIKELPEAERPRERLLKYGAESLSTAELLAILLRVGSSNGNALELAHRLLKDYDLKELSGVTPAQLKSISGIKDAKACQILACFEIAKRVHSYAEIKKPQISSSKHVYTLLSPKLSNLKKRML